MRACVNQEMCIGCGLCTGVAPEVFRMNADGKAEAFADTTEASVDRVHEAAEGCPVQAITEES